MQNQKLKKKSGAFLTISEVADHLGVEQHVLRFWETKFAQIKPLKRGGGRRYYRPEDVAVLERIHELLYKQKYTIKGAQNVLRGNTRNQIAEAANSNTQSRTPQNKSDTGLTSAQKKLLEQTLKQLQSMRSLLETAA
jgi:DNA-binding transcriptional MerR regulator